MMGDVQLHRLSGLYPIYGILKLTDKICQAIAGDLILNSDPF
ncbi:MAG: hypothetical protein VKK42_15855 [Lyngbya sp.]|nr:hypothetical protein [Lyngbya sp.]